MTNDLLARSYLTRAKKHLKILDVLRDEAAYSDVAQDVDRLAEISAWLRKEREFSFYGDIDFIPTEVHGPADAERAIADARFVVAAARRVITPDAPGASR